MLGMFKNTIAVSKNALLRRQSSHLTIGKVQHRRILNRLPRFHTIRANILHRTRTDRPRNQREVFNTRPALCHRVHHPIMPRLTCRHLTPDMRRIAPHFVNAFGLQMHSQRCEILCQHQITTATENESRPRVQARLRRRVPPFEKRRPIANTDIIMRAHRKTHRVIRGQIHAVLDLNGC